MGHAQSRGANWGSNEFERRFVKRASSNAVRRTHRATRFAVFALATLSVFILALLLAGPAPAHAQAGSQTSDLPGSNGVATPRLLVILDSSRSMRFDPGYTNSYPTEDFDPSIPAAPCDSKFCIAKRAMYNTLTQNSSLVEMGFATYYQTNVNIHHAAFAGGNMCTYDILALPNVDMGQKSGTGTDLYIRPPAGADPTPGAPSDGATKFACHPESLPNAPIACQPAPAHQCTRTVSTSTYANQYQNANCKASSPTSVGVAACTPPPMSPGTYSASLSAWDPAANYYRVPVPMAGSCSLTPYTDMTGGTAGVPASCTSTNPCAYFLDTTVGGGTGKVTGTAITANTYYPVTGPPYVISGTSYANYTGATPSTVPIASSAGATCPVTQSYTGYIAALGQNCSAEPGGVCALTSGSGTTAVGATQVGSTSTAFNNSMAVSGYSLTGVTSPTNLSYDIPITQACDQTPGTNFTVTSAGYRGLNLGCNADNTSFPGTCALTEGAVTLHTDTGTRTCTFTRTAYQYMAPGTTTYSCQYTLTQYGYSNLQTSCQYRRFLYVYTAPKYTYDWFSNGGEIMDQTQRPAIGSNCPDPHTSTGFSTGKCPAVITSVQPDSAFPYDCTSVNDAAACKLRWSSAQGTYPYGRWSNSTSLPSLQQPSFCLATDSASPIDPTVPADTNAFLADWCIPGAPSSVAYDEPPVRTADVFTGDAVEPGVTVSNSDTGALPACTNGLPTLDQIWTNTTCQISPAQYLPQCAGTPPFSNAPCQNGFCTGAGPYSVPCDNPPTFTPALDTYKDQALSVMVNASPISNEGVSSLSFVPVGVNNAALPSGLITRMLSTYNASTNSTALKMPDVGDFTPLFGSVTKAREYLQTLIDADPNAGCRSYYVLLVTDGDEDPWLPFGPTLSDANNSPVAKLRHMVKSDGTPVDVQTFVVGFGITSPTLDAMARLGGRAVNSRGVASPTGGAFNANDATSLATELNSVLGSITAGIYTRSKPVLTNDGTRLYAGYFVKYSDGTNQGGHLDAWGVDGGALSGAPVWQLNTTLDSAAVGTRRIYTPSGALSGGGVPAMESFVTGANGGSCRLANLVVSGTISSSCTAADQASADTVVNFVRNDVAAPPSSSVTYTNGIQKVSRILDIDHSIPAAVGSPPYATRGATANERASYAAFKTRWGTRTPYVFVQSNDGVVHGVADSMASPLPATAGTETFGFVPRAVLPSLKASRIGHSWLADGSFAQSDIQTGTCLATDLSDCSWKTVLLGVLGRGGPTVFSLDVTDPSSSPYPGFRWEYTDSTNMELSTSAPVVGRVTLNGALKWVAFLGGGISTQANKGNWFTVLDALAGTVLQDGAALAKWTVPSANNPTTKNNVPSRPLVYSRSGASTAATVYFGDTDGKLSRMDLSGALASWNPATWFNPYQSSSCSAVTLHNLPTCNSSNVCTATAGAALPLAGATTPAPIDNRPVSARDARAAGGNLPILYFGTGDAQNPTDTTRLNYIYAVKDLQLGSTTALACPGAALWGYQLAAGQKVLGEPAVVGDDVIYGVYTPPQAASCGAAGVSTLYCFNRYTGAPDNCLIPPDTSAGTPPATAVLPVGSPGILSDLSVISGGSSVVFNSSSSPQRLSTVRFTPQRTTLKVKTWMHVR